MRPYLITAALILALGVPGGLWIEEASLGPWAAAGIATLIGTIASLFLLHALGSSGAGKRRQPSRR